MIENSFKIIEENIKFFDEEKLYNEFHEVKTNYPNKINEKINQVISHFQIGVIPFCDEKYFPDIIKKAIDKKLPFKPKYDKSKKRWVGDKGFKDAVIWYSIIQFALTENINDNDHIILLTENIKDFKSDEMLKNFNEITGKDIHIFSLEGSEEEDKSNESSFLDILLRDSEHLTIDSITISYIELKESIKINSIRGSPLDFNLSSLFSRYIDKEEFKPQIESKIKSKFESFGFDTFNLEFNYHIPKINYVYVALRNFKLWFIDILDIELYFDDGTEFTIDDPPNENFGISLWDGFMDKKDEMYKSIINDFKYRISQSLEDMGFGRIEFNIIDYDIVEYEDPD